MDPLSEPNQEKDEKLRKKELNYSSNSLRTLLIGSISAVLLFILSFFTLFSGVGDVGDPSPFILAVLSLIISGIIAFTTSLSGIMKCGRLLYEHPTLREDILKEIYLNLGLITGIIIGAVLFIKLLRRGFFFFFF